jgi:hypothetical protein
MNTPDKQVDDEWDESHALDMMLNDMIESLSEPNTTEIVIQTTTATGDNTTTTTHPPTNNPTPTPPTTDNPTT